MATLSGELLVIYVVMMTNQFCAAYDCNENHFSIGLSSSSSLPQTSSSPMFAQLHELTVCFWMKATRTSSQMILFSYTMLNSQEVSMKMNDSHFTVQIGSQQQILKPREFLLTSDNLSVCSTWRSNDGSYTLFLNSVVAYKETSFSKNVVIQSPGKLYLGGRLGMQQSERFIGNISHFNIWSRVLPTQVIAVLGQRCGVERGDVISWNMLKSGLGGNFYIGQDICPHKESEWDRTSLVHHWSLNGPDNHVSLQYSAVYLEGRFQTTQSLFLDSTNAFSRITPATKLDGNFTIAFWMNYTSDQSRNATIISNFDKTHKEFLFKILDKKFVFQKMNSLGQPRVVNSPGGHIKVREWQHVTLVWRQDKLLLSTYVCSIYVDGYLIHNELLSGLTLGSFTPSSWNLGGTYDPWSFGYFLGYLSDVMVFKRALSVKDIGQLMAVGSPIVTNEWTPVYPSASVPLPRQFSVEIWPDIGRCVNIRRYQPADCLGALLTRRTNKVHIVNGTTTLPVPCDHATSGGGWTVIGKRTNDNAYFSKPDDAYRKGFWKNNGTFWLGVELIASMSQYSLQLFIELSTNDGNSHYIQCTSFKVISSAVVTVKTDQCSGYGVPLSSLTDVIRLFTNVSLSKVEMKIRPTKDLPTDYTLLFLPLRPANKNVRVTDLFKMSSFTICLWTKLRILHNGTLYSLVSDSLACTMSVYSPANKLVATCKDVSTTIIINLFDDKWRHICTTWNGTISHITVFIDGRKKNQSKANKQLIFQSKPLLNLGRYQTSTTSVTTSRDLIGQLGHVDVWNNIKDSDVIGSLSNGPGTESGNVLSWATVRAWVPASTVQVLHPSSCSLKESYSWHFKGSNNTLQFDEKSNTSAQVQGGLLGSDETVIIETQGYIEASDVKIHHMGMSMSFWLKQEVLISNILGDNTDYYNHLKNWLSPIVSHHATWVRCYSSKQHGWYISTFHRLCDFKGPTLTLIKVKDYVLGGLIDQSWGGYSGSIPSENAFLFTLNNPHGIPPSKFLIKKEHKSFAAHSNQFAGPSFGFNDLTVYEEMDGRVACWSNLGTSYQIRATWEPTGANIFTGSRLFYPDEIEVFNYCMPTTEVQMNPTSTSLSEIDGFYCSNSNDPGENLLWKFTKLEAITHISIEGYHKEGYVTSFHIDYYNDGMWKNTSTEYVSRAKWHKTQHAILPPVRATEIKVIPTKGVDKKCLKVTIHKESEDCGQPLGMQNHVIANKQITASSTYRTYDTDIKDIPEYRWPHRGRLDNNYAGKGWVQAIKRYDWFQVDFGRMTDVRCLKVQGRGGKKQFVREFNFAYSMDGSVWNSALTNYHGKRFQGIDSETTPFAVTVLPRSVTARFIRLYCVDYSVYCAMRTELYGNLTEIVNVTEGIMFYFDRGSNSFLYSTSTNTWKIRNTPQLKHLTHVTITWSPANSIKVYYNGTFKEENVFQTEHGAVLKPPKIALIMAGGMGTTPLKIGRLKVWGQELDSSIIMKNYESDRTHTHSLLSCSCSSSTLSCTWKSPSTFFGLSLSDSAASSSSEPLCTFTCDFEQDMCLGEFQVSPKEGVLWNRTPYCVSTNTMGECENASLTGYCISLKSLPVYHGKSSKFTTPLLHSTVSCISFSYRIDGNSTGRINVNLLDRDGIKSLLWRQFGNHGNGWHEGSIPIARTHPFKVEFEGILGDDLERYLSIDNIVISMKPCLKPGNSLSYTSVIKTEMFDHVPEYMNSFKTILTNQNLTNISWTPCYTSRDYGWNVSTFESRCQSKGPTLALVRTHNSLFGGFSESDWGREFTDPDMFSLQFDGSHDYAEAKLQRNMSSFTISFWMKTSHYNDKYMTLLSATTPERATPYLVIRYKENSKTLFVHHGSHHKEVSGHLHDGKWHHIFVHHITTKLLIYIDGVSKGEKNVDDLPIPAGALIKLACRKDIDDVNYNGLLDRVNIWSYGIGKGMASLLSRGCGQIYHGNLISWEQFKYGIRNNTKVIPSTCPMQKGDTDYDLHFNSLPGNSAYVALDSTWNYELKQFTISWWMKTDSDNEQHVMAFMTTVCEVKQSMGVSFKMNVAALSWKFVFKFVKECGSSSIEEESLDIGSRINDGYWHHVAISWTNVTDILQLNIDGFTEGEINLKNKLAKVPKDGKIILGQTPQNEDNGDLTTKLIFTGRLTDFNVMSYAMDSAELRVLALRCGAVNGDLISWKGARDSTFGKVDVYDSSSCQRSNYRPDKDAFLFVLNGTNSTFSVTKPTRNHIETSTSVQSSRGLVFGETPHDLIIGNSSVMRSAAYHGNVSFGLLDRLQRGNIVIDDIEVLYSKDTLCNTECDYHYKCDEINGGCKCTTIHTSFGLCHLGTIFTNITHFWPLDHPNNLKNLKSKLWGAVKGDITRVLGVNMHALRTGGDETSMVTLERFDTSCLAAPKYCHLTVSLWLKYWLLNTDRNQTFFDIKGLLTLYQPNGTVTQLATKVYSNNVRFAVNLFNSPAEVWSHYIIVISVFESQIYRNGKLVNVLQRNFTTLSANINDPQSGLITLSPGGARAEYDDLVIMKNALIQQDIDKITAAYTDKTFVPVRFSCVLINETWHEDLSKKDSALYLDLLKRLETNLTSFYASRAISVHTFRDVTFSSSPKGVMGNFSVSYYPWSSSSLTSLLTTVASASRINNLPVQDIQGIPHFVPNTPLNVKCTSSLTELNISWTAPTMDVQVHSWFQGYNIYYQKDGDVNHNKITVQAYKNNVLLVNPRPYIFLRIWITAYSIKGESPPSTEITESYGVPFDAPNITATYNTSSTSIYVKWDRPNGNINGYEIWVYRNDSRSKPVFRMLVNCTETNITGLEVFTAYAIQVASFSDKGRGPLSDPVISITDEEAPIGSPSNISLLNTTAHKLHLAWQPIAPSQRYGIIIGYEVEYHRLNASGVLVETSTKTSKSTVITLTNLKPYSKYRIYVRGFNSKGSGPVINGSFVFKTEEAAPSGYPTLKPEVSSKDTNAITVNWEPIPQSRLNGILRYYKIHYEESNTGKSSSKTIPVPQSRRKRRSISPHQFKLDDLKAYTNYSIKIAGFTVAQGPYSPVVVMSTGQGVPGPVVNLLATNQSSTRILVTWQRPVIVNGIITKYVVKYIDNDGVFGFRSVNTTLTSINLTGLVNYTMYVIRVTAYTIQGSGNESSTECRTDEEVPTGPPQSITALPASYTSVEMKWRPVPKLQRRGIITKYLIQFFNATSMIEQREVKGHTFSTMIIGLAKRSNYSTRIQAFTRKGAGPFSSFIHTSTNSEAPKSPPANVTAYLNSTNSILVRWSNLAQSGIRGYCVWYAGLDHPFAREKNLTVDPSFQEIVLKDLYYYARYKIRVSAFTAFDGNLSQPIYVTTGESVPTKPPSNIVVVSRSSSSVSVFWHKIPAGYRNGRVVKYRIEYRKTATAVSYNVKEADPFSTILNGLQKNTAYDVKISGRTSVGYGPSSSHYVVTDEDVPDGIPQNLTAHNWTSLYTLPVSWQPVPANQMNGKLTGYYLTYYAVKLGDKDLLNYDVTEVTLLPNATSYTIKGLQPLSVYRVGVVASTAKGVGPKAITVGETCRCTKRLSTSWSQYHPYVNITKGKPGLIMPVLVENMIPYCCGHCKEHGYSGVDFRRDGNGSSAQKMSIGELLRTMDGTTDFTFPVYGYDDQSLYKGGFGYSPLIMSPGVAFIVQRQDNVRLRQNMFNAIIRCWPVLIVPILMCYFAGFIVWALDSKNNPDHYPRSFISGIQNGFWWSFVSMTTVGYGDKAPRGDVSRIFAVFWTLCGIIIISICTSTITTSLTEVSVKKEQKLYGSKVAALQNSPEFWLGRRKNALVNENKEYHTLVELMQALDQHEVEGILVDTFAAGSRSDLFNKPSLRIAQVLDYKMAYGIVTAGYAIQLRQCFQEYIISYAADIFHNISNNVKKIEYKQDLPEQIITDGLFNTKAEQFRDSVKYTGCALILMILCGICFEWIRRLRTRAPIQEESDIVLEKKIMRDLVEEFKKNTVELCKELTQKHNMELRKARKLRKRQVKAEEEILASTEVQYFKMEMLSPKTDKESIQSINNHLK